MLIEKERKNFFERCSLHCSALYTVLLRNTADMTSLSWLSHAVSQSCCGVNIHLIKRKPFHLESGDHKETRIRISAKTSGIITFKLSHIYCMLASCMATLFLRSWCGISCCFVGYVTMLINNTLLQKKDCIFWNFLQCIMYIHSSASTTQHFNSTTKTAEECSSKTVILMLHAFSSLTNWNH